MGVSTSPQPSTMLAQMGGGHKSQAQQRREMRQLYARCLLKPEEYQLYRFYEPDKDYRYMLNFLPNNALRNKFRVTLNDQNWKVVLDNKWLFHLHYQQFGLPLPQVYGIYDPSGGFADSGQSLSNAESLKELLLRQRPSTLVIKPLGGIMGKRLMIFSSIDYSGDEIRALTNTGETLSFAEIIKILDQPPNVRYYMSGGYQLNLTGYLLQERLSQHPFLSALAPSTTNTIRVVTFLDQHNQVDIQFTILRLGRQGNTADNWDRGGISVAVNPATGVLGQGVLKPKYGGTWTEVHPDTGVRFTGQQLPYWDEVIALCRKAAEVTPKVRSIGWDVALTPDGPVLIEGNPDWDLHMVQVHSNGLLQPDVRAKLAAFGLRFPEERLPAISVKDWWVRLREQSRERVMYKSTVPRRIARALGIKRLYQASQRLWR